MIARPAPEPQRARQPARRRGWLFSVLLAAALADAATLLACLAALGQNAAPATALIALVMASIIVTLGPVPLGLGSFEAMSTATLHLLGVPVEAAFAGTMLLRLFTLWLPLLPGLWMMRAATGRRRKS